MHSERRLFLLALGSASLVASLSACGAGNAARMPRPAGAVRRVEQTAQADFPTIPFAAWTDEEPEYLLYPGDEIEVATPTAAELTRTMKIGPDGRIALPLIGQVMAAERTLPQLQQAVSAAYAPQLVRPVVEVTLRQAGPIRVWVDGEVRTPGVFEMTGDLDAYQAVIQAGGFSPTSRPDRVALIRRGPGGTRMMRVVDLGLVAARSSPCGEATSSSCRARPWANWRLSSPRCARLCRSASAIRSTARAATATPSSRGDQATSLTTPWSM